MKAVISPSLLSADFANLGHELGKLEKAGVAWAHLDVIDGNFAPNITFGQPVIKSLRPGCKLFFDTHLMVENPDRYLESFAKAGADLLVVHYEAIRHGQKCMAKIHELGLKAGLALNPGTDFTQCRWLLPDTDMLLLMSVNPGFSGQKFIPQTLVKLRGCRQFLNDLGYGDIPIQVDGGVTTTNAAELVKAGADILVSGSAFFGINDYALALEQFDRAIEKNTIGEDKFRPGYEIAASWKHGDN